MKAIKLTFQGPVHFGTKRLSDSGYSFDAGTLFSALYIEAMRIGVQDELLDAARMGKLALSDAFPFIGDTLYVPKPVLPVVQERYGREGAAQDPRLRKAAKKLAYVPCNLLDGFLKGECNPVSMLEQFELGSSSEQSRVNLLREKSEDAEPFQVGRFRFSEGAGLYFLVGGDYNLSPIMEQLSWSGLGGKRSSGCGRFVFEEVDFPMPTTVSREAGKARHMLLATAIPASGELTDELLNGANYKLVSKGGFAYSESARPMKKKEAFLFQSGSVFDRKFEGAVLDVRAGQPHPVYRYAKAMWMDV